MTPNTSTRAIGDFLIEQYHIKTPINTGIPLIYREGFYDDLYSEKIIKQITNQINSYATTYNVNEVYNYITRRTYCHLDYEKKYICLENGHFNLDTLELEGCSPDRLITFKLPVKYNKDANTEQWNDCYINSMVRSEADALKLQEHCGNILTPHYETKKLLHLYGPEHSGKSTLISILQEFLGKRNYSNLSLHQVGEKFTNAQIYNKHANFCADIPYKLKFKHYGILKSLTGGDTLTLQFKYRDAFEYASKAKLFFSANGMSVIDQEEADNAFYSRWDFIEFPYSFEPDETIFTKYTTPEIKSAILLWMIRGYQRLRENHWHFTNELSIEGIKDMFRNTAFATSIENIWLVENYIPSLTGWIRKKEIHSSYEGWCSNKSVPALDYRTFCKWILNQESIHVSDYNPTVEGVGQVNAFKGIQKRE